MNLKGFAAAVALAAFLTGCGGQSASTPEATVAAIYRHCGAGEYSKAAAYFEGGPEVWREDPGLVRQVVDRVCDRQRVVVYEVTDQQARGQGASLRTQGYRDEAKQQPYRSLLWRLVQKDGRWLVVQVV